MSGLGIGGRTRLATAALVCALGLAQAQELPRHHHGRTDPDLDAALVIEAKTGGVIYARNADAPRRPASLTKMMTLYLLFERLRANEIALDTRLAVSAAAAEQPRSHVRLREGETISVDMAIKAIAVGSANDAAVAVAEALGGSEAHFAELMTAKARRLGMAHTFFHNATGLPDDMQQSTAQDLSILARHLIYDFPQYYGYFRLTQMRWRGADYTTHNSLLENYAGADGIKTGYIDASGYNLVGTAERGGRRLIAVVMGGLTAERRDEEMIALLDDGFQSPVAVPPRASAPHPRPPPAPVSKSTGTVGVTAFVAAAMIDPWSPVLWVLAAVARFAAG